MDEKPAFVHAVYVPLGAGPAALSVLFRPDGTIEAEACASIAEAEHHRFAQMAEAGRRDIGVD